MNLNIFYGQIFERKKIGILWQSVQWERSCYMRVGRRTDGHEEAKIRFSQFCEHAKKKAFWLGHFCDQVQAKL